jgi:ABC-type Fe3+/spermidine/putrescine transport system ATPase subunit
VAVSLAVDVAASFGAFDVDVSLSVDSGETLAVLGPSGAGKTRLLETVAGFHDHEGHVAINGTDATDAPPEDRDLGVVFQDHVLFEHRTVRGNVAFGQRYRDGPDPTDLLATLGVADLADRNTATLSGGERGRVALAAALAVDPAVLLLDEPLASLDPPTRRALREDLLATLARRTAVVVTHDRTTARVLGDRVAVLHDGRVEQVGDPFAAPATPFVAEFTGSNCLPGALLGRESRVAIRPEHVVLGAADPDCRATVRRVAREEAVCRVTLDAGGTTVEAFDADPPAEGATVGVSFPSERVTALSAPADSGP